MQPNLLHSTPMKRALFLLAAAALLAGCTPSSQGPASINKDKMDAAIPYADAKVHIQAPAMKFGIGVFEGVRGYWNAGRQVFR